MSSDIMTPPNGTEDRRQSQRRRTIKGASLILPRSGSTFSCVLRNLSEGGAMVELPSTLGVPFEVILETADSQVKRRARVVWRTETRMGLAFID